MSASGLHISISAERLFTIGGMGFTNSMLSSLIVSSLLILFAVWVNLSLRKTNKPTGVQNFAEFIVESLESLVSGVTNSPKRTADFFPFVASFFMIILCNNWFGLLPGVGSISVHPASEEASLSSLQHMVNSGIVVHASTIEEPATTVNGAPLRVIEKTDTQGELGTVPVTEEASSHAAEGSIAEEAAEHEETVHLFRGGTADLNATIALGIMSIFLVQFFGFKYLGIAYLGKFFNFSSPINFFVGFLELVSEMSRIISFAFRLFGNVFAGEVLLTVITFLAKIVVPMPFYGLEVFVGFIQALVFAMLSVVFFNMATLGHGEEH